MLSHIHLLAGWKSFVSTVSHNLCRGRFSGSGCFVKGSTPEVWLHYVIGHIQDWPGNRVRDLLPWKADLTSV
jgi:hypothetical protein